MANPYGPPGGAPYGSGPGGPPAGAPVFGGGGADPAGLPGGGGSAASVAAAVDPLDRPRRIVGLSLWTLGVVLGVVLNVVLFVLPAIHSPESSRILDIMGKAALVAYIPVWLYLLVPALIDRFDPEPWWALALVFFWGALMATGYSGLVNTILGALFGEFVGSAISAPVFEELFKGLAIFGIMFFLRREFDGVVDGIIYGTFVAIGFAATENIIYYLRGGMEQKMFQVFFVRGLLTPWLHPLFTAMTGIGFGLAREHGARWAKVLFPLGGYFVGVLLHAWWNGLPQIVGLVWGKEGLAVVINMLVGIGLASIFFFIIVWLVVRKGRTMRAHLQEEVLIGTISEEELKLICSPVGRTKALFSWGLAGRRFVRVGARLALSKWHTARAINDQKGTISADFIAPLRQELGRLRGEMRANAGSV